MTAMLLKPQEFAAAARAEVLVDGGIRRGTDVMKRLSMGVQAVLTGWPIYWGLVAGREAGARHVLELMRAEPALHLLL